jgi:hypothetical protein
MPGFEDKPLTLGQQQVSDESGYALVTQDLGLLSDATRRLLQSNIPNGDFALPPPVITDIIDDTNILPYWTYLSVSPGVSFQWIANASTGSGGVIRASIDGTVAACEAYLYIIVPVNSSLTQAWTHQVRMGVTNVTGDTGAQVTVKRQYLKSDRTTTTGAETTDSVSLAAIGGTGEIGSTGTLLPTPSDAAYLRIKIGASRGSATAAATADFTDAWLVVGNNYLMLTDRSNPALEATAIYQQAGDLLIVPQHGTGTTGSIVFVTTGTSSSYLRPGMGGNIAVGVNSLTADSGAVTTTETVVLNDFLAAGQGYAGLTWFFQLMGSVTSSVANTINLRVRIGPTTLTGAVVASLSKNATTTASSDGFMMSGHVTIRSTGGGGLCKGNFYVIGSPAQPFANENYATSQTAAVAIDTTVDNLIEVTVVTGAGTTTVNVRDGFIQVAA